MRKLAKILLTAGGLGLATAAVATPALSDVRLNLNFGTPGYYYAPYGYYGYRPYHRPYYYDRYHYRPYYYRHW
jgi:hypothetical protein